MTKLEIIEGLGSVYADKLRAAGIGNVEALPERRCSPKARQEMEEATGIGHALILEWVNLADLIRIKGISEECSNLLKEAGVDRRRSRCTRKRSCAAASRSISSGGFNYLPR